MTALTRATAQTAGRAPVRVVHLGLGSFHRTHQAWYTHRANLLGSEPAGIAAFTGRHPGAAARLNDQDGLYHLLVRNESDSEAELVESIAAAIDGNDVAAWNSFLASPDVGCLTLTVTEAGYRRGHDGGLDKSDSDVIHDIGLLGRPAANTAARTAPGRIVQGLNARRNADVGPITVVSCDNLVDNGSVCRRVVSELATACDPGLAGWISEEVSFASTMVDRITPRTLESDIASVRAITGFDDADPVVTEPFTEWVLSGDFPATRPEWELAGARFVSDVGPYERRKLWLLNGSHSLLAYAGGTRGHQTISSAIADSVCREWVEWWWDEASRHLSLPAAELTAYRNALLERYHNTGIRHALTQIAADGSQKMAIRVLPVLARERANGILPPGSVVAVAGWLAHLRSSSTVQDPLAGTLAEATAGSAESSIRRLLTLEIGRAHV